MRVKTQTAHFLEDGPQSRIMEILRDAHGQETPAGRSIEASAAIVTLGSVLIHLLAQFEDEDRDGVWDALRRRSTTVRSEMLALHDRGGSA